MATSNLPLLLVLLLACAGTAVSARPCKTLFYFSATTTTTYYPFNPNPKPNPNSDRYLTLIFTTGADQFSDRRPFLDFDSNKIDKEFTELPAQFYSSASSSIRDRTKDIMSIVGALLFGVGCGVLTAATMYFVWAVFFPNRFGFEDLSFSSDDDDDDNDDGDAKKFAYVAIPTKAKAIDGDDDLKKPAPPAKEVV